jgi:hypothetical protein
MVGRFILLLGLLLPAGAAAAAGLPPIVASADNMVPDCVKPAALMQFVAERNATRNPPRYFDPRFADLASVYHRVGTCVARAPENVWACAGTTPSSRC